MHLFLFLNLVFATTSDHKDEPKNVNTEQNEISRKWRPIRITADHRILEGKKDDPLSCKRVGQEINYTYDGLHICEEKDLLSKKQILAIKGTMNNVIKFLSKTLKVQSRLTPILAEDKKFSNTDLVISTSYRFFSDDTVATESSISWDSIYFRPYFAKIFFSPIHVPDKIINENDFDNEFFYTILHEITHALGFDKTFYDKYHPHENPEPYKNPICQFSKYGKNFTFLVTPY